VLTYDNAHVIQAYHAMFAGFPAEDLESLLGRAWGKISGCFLCLVVIVLICILVPTRCFLCVWTPHRLTCCPAKPQFGCD